MAIEVLCPNGHKIICPEDRAGRSARCPRCSEPFRIPRPSGNGQSPDDSAKLANGEPVAESPRPADSAMVSAGDSSASDSSASGAADSPGGSSSRSNMALAVNASAEDADVVNSAEVLADWSGLSDLRLLDSGILAKGEPLKAEPAAAAAAEETEQHIDEKPVEQPPTDDMILFLCPSGHKLHGLKRLAGKVGQCPHCGTKFEIPFPYETDDDLERDRDGLDDTVTEDPLADFAEDAQPGLAASEQPVFEEERPEPRRENDTPSKRGLFGAVRATGNSVLGRITGRSGKRQSQSDVQHAGPSQTPMAAHESPTPAVPPPERASNALAALVTQLWSERDHGGVIELHLRGGSMLAPDWFDARQSQDTHGLFASQAADGTVTMTIVPWEEITRVVVRGVVGLPDGLFE